MLRNGVETLENALAFCKHVSEGEAKKVQNMTDLKTLIIEINREISKQFFKIVISTCEVTSKNMIVWMNTKNDEISRLQNIYSALELEYFHSILQEILNSEEHKITFIVCINITSTLSGFFSRDSGQNVLNKWLKAGYFIRRDSHIHLGPRLILEFTSYLKTHYPDSMCNLCSELVFTGSQCQSCNKTLHSYCLSKYLINQKSCPCCHTPWTEIHGGEVQNSHNSQSTDEDEEMQESSVMHKRPTENHNTSNGTEVDSDDDPNKPGPSTRRSKRRK
ncbi:hypothetical protein JTB14_015457 [Gonioctena quinquepunctata]|nr:hypothetical protein JTB14_015457 [Gonioctena quinquepunctata]